MSLDAFIQDIYQRYDRVKGNIYTIDYIVENYGDVLSANGAITAEFGVYHGNTINKLAKRAHPNVVHGFDSFEGLPETWRPGIFEKGCFNMHGGIPKDLAANVELHVGWFDATLPKFKELIGDKNLACIHIDCDLYSSTKTILNILKDNIRDTILIFDELLDYSGFEDHEIKAFWEFLQENPDISIDLIYGCGEAVIFKVIRAG